MANDRKDKDIWAQLLSAAQTEAAKQQDVTAPKGEPEDPWEQLLGAAEKHIEEQESTPAVSDAPFAKGSMLLDTYRVESDPIEGGMGSVWRVRHTGWNVDLAMKRPQAKMFANESSKQGFIDECQNWINLGLHPNIVSCYYVREIDGVPTIFSEWMENGDLEKHIRDGSLYDGNEEEVQKRLLDIAIQYARGLRYAHEQGLIHQDVKPANLLLTNDWQAKAADFGLANARAQLTVLEGDTTQQDPGKSLNAAAGGYTPAYCSMEQMDGKQLTRRTDIYSWAVSVLEMYYGSRPWANGPVAGMSCREYMGDPECRVPMPGKLRELLAQCMALNAEERPHDFGAIENELKKIWQEATGGDYPRREPRNAVDTAASLNNRALSYIDLGKDAEARQLLRQAEEKDSSQFLYHLNYALLQWNNRQFSDVQLMSYLHKNQDKSELYAKTMEAFELVRGHYNDAQKQFNDTLKVVYPSNDKELNRIPGKEGAESLHPLSAASTDGRFRVQGYVEYDEHRREHNGYRIENLQTGEIRDFPNDFEDYGESTPLNAGTYMHPHRYKDDKAYFAGPHSELVIMDADALWIFDSQNGRLLLSLPPVVDEDGDTFSYETMGYTDSGIIQYCNHRDRNPYIHRIQLHPELCPTYELAGIDTAEARLDAEESIERNYQEAISCWERKDIDGAFRSLNRSMEDQVITQHEPSMRLWSKLGAYYRKGKLVTVLPTSDPPTPPPERNECIPDQEFKMNSDFKNGSDNGQTSISVSYTEETEYDWCNDAEEYYLAFSLRATDDRSGITYFSMPCFESTWEADWKAFSRDRYVGLKGDYLLWWAQEYAEPQTIDLREREVRFSLPGAYWLQNTSEGVNIGGFVFPDKFTDFRPLWNSDVIGCRDHNYRLIYRYLPKEETESTDDSR
ncbi:MAG: protein kinase [Clostridiales bacterium]|nr:protein kinase [Clostridiales bacterium]